MLIKPHVGLDIVEEIELTENQEFGVIFLRDIKNDQGVSEMAVFPVYTSQNTPAGNEGLTFVVKMRRRETPSI